MKKWKKALTCGLMSLAAICLSVFGIALQSVDATATTTTVFSGNSACWQKSSGFFQYDGKTYVNNAPAYTAGGYKSVAKSVTLEGNSTINLSLNRFNLVFKEEEPRDWTYNWIVFQDTTETFSGVSSAVNDSYAWIPSKVRDTDGDKEDDMPADSAGNWMALVFGNSESAVTLYECDGGKVTKEAVIATQDYLGNNNTTTNISISTVDTQTGVTVNITYTANGNTYTYVHTSENTSLWGEHTFTLGYYGNHTCATNSNGAYSNGTFIYENISVTESPSNNVYKSYNTVTDETKWGVTNNLTTTTDGTISVQAPNRPTGATDVFDSYAQTTQVGGNSTIDLTMKGTIKKGTSTTWDKVGLWAYDWILFKNTNSNYGYNWHPSVYEQGAYNTSPEENWLAFAFGASVGSVLYECNGGVITRRDIQNDEWKATVSPDGKMSGYDTWYTYAQTTNIKITTKDTDTGVFVKLTYYASDIDSTLGVTQTNFVYEYTYKSNNTNLWGDQSYVIGHYGNGEFNATENYAYDIRIMDVKSTQTNNVAGDLNQWDLEESVNATNVTFLGDDGMRFGNQATTTAMLLKKNVLTNSTLTFNFDANASTAGYADQFIVFKNKSENLDADVPVSIASTIIQKYNENNTGTGAYSLSYESTNEETENWLALYFGSRPQHFWILECTEGDVTCTPMYDISNYAHWYLRYNQKTAITITTRDLYKDKDGHDGVRVAIDLTVSACTNETGKSIYDANTNNYTQSVTYTSTNSALMGDYAVSVGAYSNVTAGEYLDLAKMAVYAPDATVEDSNSKSGMYIEDYRGASLSMDGDVGVNVYMALAPSVWKDAAAQVDFYVDGVLHESVFLSDQTKVNIDGTDCYKISCGLPPKDYETSLRVLLALRENVYEVYNGTIVKDYISGTKQDYEKKYEGEEESAWTEEDKHVYNTVIALEDYVNTAKDYFAYEDTGADMATDLTIAQDKVNEVIAVDENGKGVYASTYEIWNTDKQLTPQDFAYAPVTLLLKSETVFRFYIRTDNIDNWKVSVNVNYTGEETTPDEKRGEAQFWTRKAEDSQYYYVEIKDIAITEIDEWFTITVENQTDYSRITYKCSVYSYMRAVFNLENTKNENAQLSTLLRIMLVYQQKAEAYDEYVASLS